MKIVNKLIIELQSVTKEKQMKAFLFDFIDILQLDYFLLGISFPLSIIKSDILTIDNYQQGWRERCDQEQFIQSIPTINYCTKNHSPIFWGRTDSPAVKKIWGIMFANTQSGFAVPLHGVMGAYGMLSLCTSANKSDCDAILLEALRVALLIIPYLQDAILRIRETWDIEKVQLTMREVECLTWATEGKSAWEIATILGCSERTVTFHLNNATAKLNCRNRYQAIGKALLSRIITPNI